MHTVAPLLDTRTIPLERAHAAPDAVLPPPSAHPFRTGRGEVRAHHGEIVQGVFYSPEGTLEHWLVTLPCSLFATRATFRPLRSGPLTVEPGDRSRARAAARLTLDALGRTGWGGSIRIEGNVPLRWGCGSSTTDVLATVRAELAKVAADGITQEELDRGKGQLKGGLVLGLEDSGARMSRLGKGELLYDELLTVDQVLAAVDAVTPEDVREVATLVLGGQPSLAVIGPFADHDFSGVVRG